MTGMEPMRPVPEELYRGRAPYTFRWYDLAFWVLGGAVAFLVPDVNPFLVIAAFATVWFAYRLTVTLRARSARGRTQTTE